MRASVDVVLVPLSQSNTNLRSLRFIPRGYITKAALEIELGVC